MAYYVGIFVPLEAGGWRALFPDIPHWKVDEPSLDMAIFRAASALAQIQQSSAVPVPAPRDLTEIQTDEGWAAACDVDWQTCVVAMIPMAGQ